jgi:glycosyltransferase involved in cell wall biosynthesis
LSIDTNDCVFAFTSHGHYLRKGFWLIVEALRQIFGGSLTPIKLLVIGGSINTLNRLQHQLDQVFSSWPDCILLAGHQNDTEEYLAAADAFIMPSYFEAFCLAEIEAAAMGIPLFLTRHPGSEMILKEHVNGIWLDFDPKDIAAKMLAFSNKDLVFTETNIGEALTQMQLKGASDSSAVCGETI